MPEINLDVVSHRIVSGRRSLSATWNTRRVHIIISAERMNMAIGLSADMGDKEKTCNFEEYEKCLKDEQSKQMLAIEVYKDLVKSLGCDNYNLSKRWYGLPTLSVSGLCDKSVEFMFSPGDNTLRLHHTKHHYTIPMNDNYVEAIYKVLAVLDYIEKEEPCESAE